MNRKECLDAAAEAVLKNRQATYGPPESSFADTAVVWSVIVGFEIKPWQVPLMLAGLKVVRAKASPQHADNWADLAGYAACGAELATATSYKPQAVTVKGGLSNIDPKALAEYMAKTPPKQRCDIPDDPMPSPKFGFTAEETAEGFAHAAKALTNETR